MRAIARRVELAVQETARDAREPFERQLHFGGLARGLQPTQRLKNHPPQEHDLSDRQRPEDRRGNVADAAIGLVAAGLIEIVEARLGTDIAFIPYKGAAPAIADLLGGQIQT